MLWGGARPLDKCGEKEYSVLLGPDTEYRSSCSKRVTCSGVVLLFRYLSFETFSMDFELTFKFVAVGKRTRVQPAGENY